MKTFSLALALCLATSGAAAQQRGPVTLRFRYTAGQRARYATRTTQVMPGGAGTTTTTSSHEVETARVNADGSAVQRLHITRFDVSGGTIPEDLRGRVTSAVTGVTLEFTQDPRGHVSARRTIGTVPDEARPVLDGMLDSLDQIGAQLPEGPVSVGSTWHEQRTLHVMPGGDLDMRVDVTCTLREVRGVGPAQTAVVGIAMTLSTPPGANVRGVRLNGSGNATGEAVMELGRGRLGRGHTAGAMRVQMNISGRAINLESTFEHDMTPEAAAPANAAPARPASPARPTTTARPR